jgi:hypothetical protein
MLCKSKLLKEYAKGAPLQERLKHRPTRRLEKSTKDIFPSSAAHRATSARPTLDVPRFIALAPHPGVIFVSMVSTTLSPPRKDLSMEIQRVF